MKLLNTIVLLLLAFGLAQAKQVDANTAMNVGKSFLANQTNSNKFSHNLQLTLVYTGTSGTIGTNNAADAVPYFYVFNINGTQGFVIVSAEDNVKPILAYSDERGFNPGKIAANTAGLLDNYKRQIQVVKTNNIPATPEITTRWNNLLNNIQAVSANQTKGAVAPLVQTTWDQAPYYNDDCPYDATAAAHCVTGCPATAMAQILRFWSYPAQGTGIATYNDPKYGTQTANYGATTYNWANMPNSVTSANADVALLMYQCGVGVNMTYGVQESGGYVITADAPVCSQTAFVNYFGYNPATIQGLQRANYDDATWTTMLENDLTAGHPIQYAGFGPGGGHTWVCDGFDANNMFHMNWGWSGYDDGYYGIDALNPSSGGIGAGDGAFNSGEEALMGIVPLQTVSISVNNLQLNSVITVTPNPISFATAFTVNADIMNYGSASFSGTFGAIMFDSVGNLITVLDTVQTTTPLATGGNYSGGLNFPNGGLLTVPGKYSIGIYYRPTGGNWHLVGDSLYTNPLSVQISSPSDSLELYSAITATPSVLVEGQSATVTANFLNLYAAPFTGQYEAALIDPNTGNILQVFDSLPETTGLTTGNSYNSPISFSTNSVSVHPGTYILGIAYEPAGYYDWYYVGGDFYTNPVNIKVVAPTLPPDQYEADDSVPEAYLFPVVFNVDTAIISTNGANINTANDLDYYKFDLPQGNGYTVSALLHDATDSPNTMGLTLIAITSYSTDSGATWSAVSPGGVVNNVYMPYGGSVFFEVAPYFPGESGTYQLVFDLFQGAEAVNKVNNNIAVHVFPNPVSGILSVSTDDAKGNFNMEIFNALGQQVSQSNGTLNGQLINTDVSGFAAGMYMLQLTTTNGTVNTKFIVK